jgi:hypothetical protein
MGKVKVLLLGDSISMGYRSHVQSMLGYEYEVVFPSENGKFSAHTYRMLWEWNIELKIRNDVDIVYWNNGLWDVVRVYGDSPQTPIDEYGRYLEKVYYRLRKLCPLAKIVFATTTPVKEDEYCRDFYRLNKDIRDYNDKARQVLANKVDYIDDLYEFAKTYLNDQYKDPTHFHEAGNKKMAGHVVVSIKGNCEEIIKQHKDTESKLNSSMKKILEEFREENTDVVLWGTGDCFENNVEMLKCAFNIKGVVDSNSQKHGMTLHGYKCIAPGEIKSYANNAIIMVYDERPFLEIASVCEKMEIRYVSFKFIAETMLPKLEENIVRQVHPSGMKDHNPHAVEVMKKYIGINIPAYECNLRCGYCYLSQTEKRMFGIPKFPHSPIYLRYQLSYYRVGGSALIGLCAYGETFLSDSFIDICIELLKEGHYLHIVTNGVLKKEIQSLLSAAGPYASHIIFKLSFHYLELRNRNLLDKFVENVQCIDQSEASYTIELMPHDELIPYISDIQTFSLEHFGAYPQLTIGRDDGNNHKLLTRYTYDEYYKIWKVFDSEMFETRMKFYMFKGKGCNAGTDAFFIDAYTGNIARCIFNEKIDNIYRRDNQLEFKPVGDSCPMEYCYNCHVYATLGLMEKCNAPTYLTIRDRVKSDGTHWIKENMRRFLDTKLFAIHE